MMPDEIAAVVEGTRVVIDLSGYRFSQHLTWLMVSVGLSMGAIAVGAVVVDRVHRRRLLLSVVGAAVGGAFALSLAPIVLGVFGRWMPELGMRVSQGSLLAAVAGAGVGAVLVALPITFTSTTRPRAGWLACGVLIIAAVVGITGVVRAQRERQNIVVALREALPMPRLIFAGQAGDGPLPEVHVGRLATLKAERVMQLETTGQIFPTPTLLPAGSVPRWGLDQAVATLTATTAGEYTTTVVMRQGPVRVEQPVRFLAINDTSPAAFALTPGGRRSWQRLRGSRGVVADALDAQRKAATSKKKPKNAKAPTADISAIVLSERIDNGLRVAQVQVTTDGLAHTDEVIARNGQLVLLKGGPFLTIEASSVCRAPFLGFDDCQCTNTGVESCTSFDSDTFGAVLRIGLLVATAGMSEVIGACKNCGDGSERGLLLLP